MQESSATSNSPYLRKEFPTREILIYWAVQIGLGLLLSTLNLEHIQWLQEAFIPMENIFPTFKTGFVQSTTPIASKIFLLIWWLVILPWGLKFSYDFTEGFKPHPYGLSMNYTALLGYFAAGLFVTFMLSWLLSFHDHSNYWTVDKKNSPSRGDLMPALMTNGPLPLSIWAAGSSFVLLMALITLICIFRAILKKLTEVKK